MGCLPEPANPVFLNINQYMGKTRNDDSLTFTFGKYKINKYMKISDYFFNFYFNEKGDNTRCLYYFNTFLVTVGFFEILFFIYIKINLIIKNISIFWYII